MRKYILYISALVVALFATSCDEKLEVEPEQSLSPGASFSNLAGVQAAVGGMYDRLQQLNYYGRDFVVGPEVRADNVFITTDNSNRYIQEYSYTITVEDGGVSAFYTDVYQTIKAANNIIANIDGGTVPREGQEATVDAILAEALFVRALAHFDAVRTFARPYTENNGSGPGVPLVLSVEDEFNGRATVAEVYDAIIADLNRATTLSTFSTPYRASGTAAHALLSRVHLYKGDNAAAVASANSVTGFSILDAAAFLNTWDGDGTTAEVFTLRFVAAENRGSDNLGNIYIETGYGDLRPTQDIIDFYEAGDIRRDLILNTGAGNRNDDYIIKYPGIPGVPGLNSPRIIRYEEVILNRAEANARLGNFAQARTDLDAIRTRAGLAASTAADADLVNAILDERRKELAFEGHRLFDLLRTGQGVNRIENSGLAGSPSVIPFSDTRLIYPIPFREILANPNLEGQQNPGY